jgi:DNA (cytosine-5)-methyltransferase 3A
LKVLSLFDGISCCQRALEELDIKVEYYASEINDKATQITQKNYPNTVQLGDIKEWKSWNLPELDLITGGSPCQGFSHAGRGLNFKDPRSKLFFDFVDILNYYKPKYFLLENVRMKKEWCKIINSFMGTEPIIHNSNMFVPQNRVRLYWTNILQGFIPVGQTGGVIEDILQRPEEVSDSYFLTEAQKSKLDLDYRWRENKIITHKAGKHQQDTIYRYDGIMGCLSAATHGAARHLTKTFLPDNRGVRRLTEIECERLQGLPDNYTEGVSSSSRYEAIGNGWTVPVVKHVLKNLKGLKL